MSRTFLPARPPWFAITWVLCLLAAPALAAVTAGQKCDSSKIKSAGKYAACRTKVDAKIIAKGGTTDYGKCNDKLSGSFEKAESKGGDNCATSGNSDAIQTALETCVNEIVTGLGGISGTVEPHAKCESAKVKAVGKNFGCRFGAESKGVKKGVDPDFSKCAPKFDGAFEKAELKPPCATDSDTIIVASAIQSCFDSVLTTLTEPITFTWPNDPSGYTAGPSSVITSLVVPPPGTCCKDFGAISKNLGPDNALAGLASAVSILGVDLNAEIADALGTEQIVLLLDHYQLDLAALPANFELAALFGAYDNGTTFADALTGNAEFLINPNSFVPGTGEPAGHAAASFDASSMATDPFDLTLQLPFGFGFGELSVSEGEINGVVGTTGPNGIEYTSGTISGYVPLTAFFDAFNAVAASECSCASLTGDPFTFDETLGMWTSDCSPTVEMDCTDPGEDICVTLLGTACSVIPITLPGLADIDTDGNTNDYEALSLGLELTAEQAQINGIAP